MKEQLKCPVSMCSIVATTICGFFTKYFLKFWSDNFVKLQAYHQVETY